MDNDNQKSKIFALNEQARHEKEGLMNIHDNDKNLYSSSLNIAVDGVNTSLEQNARASSNDRSAWPELKNLYYCYDPYLEDCLDGDKKHADLNVSKPIKAAKQRLSKGCDAFAENALDGARHWKLNENEEKTLLNILGTHGYGGEMRASDRVLRTALGGFVIDEICAFQKYQKKAPFYNMFYWLTFFCDEAITTDRDTKINIYAMKEKVQHALRNYTPLSAFSFVDIQAVTNWPQKGHGRALLVKAHVLVWTHDVFVPHDILGKAKGFNSSFEIPIHLRYAKNSKAAFARMAGYLCKVPLKNKVLKKGKEKRYLYQTEDVRPDLHLRLAEILSHIPVRRLMFSVGEGQEIRTKIINKLEYWHKSKLRTYKERNELPYEKVGAFWKRIRTKNKKTLYQPPIVITERITKEAQ